MEIWLVGGAALVVLFLVINMFSLSLKLLWNGICGVVLLWLFNLLGGIFGVTIPIHFISALVAVVIVAVMAKKVVRHRFGLVFLSVVPGVVLMLLYQLMGH